MRNCLGVPQWIGIAVILSGCAHPVAEQFNYTNTVKYSGRAIPLQVIGFKGALASPIIRAADSGAVPIMGGENHNFMNDAVLVPGVTAQELDGLTRAATGKNSSQAWLAHLDAKVGPHRITALWVESKASAMATEQHRVVVKGGCNFEGLMVDGQATTVTGEVNQTIVLPDGYLVLNEQSGTGGTHFGTITVNALDLVVDAGNLIVGSSKAEVIDAAQPGAGPYDK